MTRRALVVDQPGTIGVVERPRLRPGPGEVVVRPALVGVCGTDLELLRGEVDAAYVRYPLTLGHEWAGTVEAAGDGVELAAGDAVVAEGLIPCGRCAACRSGATNVCEVYDELGFTREGGASDQVVVPARLVHRLAPGVSLLDGTLVEPTAVVLQALTKARLRPGLHVLVVGDGTIGLLAAYLASLWSPASLTVLGRRPEQARLAGSVGAAFTTDDGAVGDVDVAIEAAGATDAVSVAVRAARRGGTVVLLGLPPTGRSVELPADLLVNNDLTLAASFGYTSAAWTQVVALLNAGLIAPSRIVTHRFPLERHADAFAALASADGERGKVVLEI